MNVLTAILRAALECYTPHLVIAALAVAILTGLWAPDERKRMRSILLLVVLHLLLVPVLGVLSARGLTGTDVYLATRLITLVLAAVAAVRLALVLVFALALARLGVHAPRILRELIGAGASIAAILAIASRVGLNLSGIIATSAVLTAVVGLSLQDTLGNVMAGLALQMDHSVQIGDWIKVGDLSGKVIEVRWRSTRIETRNWETVVIPNSQLVRNQFLILGKRSGQPRQWRRWVYFNVDFRTPPPRVIDTVEGALRGVQIQYVAADPEPSCIMMDLGESTGRYALRYWLTDLAADDPTDSAVRTRIHFALRRAGIPLAIPAQSVFVTEETRDRAAQKHGAERARRLAALGKVELFDLLSVEDRERLADGLHHTPFARGEVMTRQGAVAHWLYMIIEGEALVRVEVEGGLEREVARLGAGSFFGEMSLLTGLPRTATVVAATEVECYRLDKTAFEAIIAERPELADGLAEVLARRQLELAEVREVLDATAREQQLAARKQDLLGRIRGFFNL